jgi:hypothetical protein
VPTIAEETVGIKPKMELRKEEMNERKDRLKRESFELNFSICGGMEVLLDKETIMVLRPKKPVRSGRSRLKLKVKNPRTEESAMIIKTLFLSARTMRKTIASITYGKTACNAG